MLGESGIGREFWGRKLKMTEPVELHPVDRSFHLVKAVIRPVDTSVSRASKYIQLLVDTGSRPDQQNIELHRYLMTDHVTDRQLDIVFKKGANLTFSLGGNTGVEMDDVTVDLIGYYVDDDDEDDIDKISAHSKGKHVETVTLYANNVSINPSPDAGKTGDVSMITEFGDGGERTPLMEELKRRKDEMSVLENKVKQLENMRMVNDWRQGAPVPIPTIIVTETEEGDTEGGSASW